ncbi:MAG: ATP-dependent Clp protease adaptor ClpS [Turicibacter sp.]|nr:ATP-dependent Clp protease adaptor ClpS [Turicibacter sp.]
MEREGSVSTIAKTHYKEPNMYSVILHNDDITSMDFVVELLVKVFHKSSVEASDIMMTVHNENKGIAGVYTYDIALTKKTQADIMSEKRGFPLKLTVEENGI